MRNLFSTKVKVLVVLAILLSIALAIASGVSNTSVVDLAVKGALAPFRAASTALLRRSTMVICSAMRHWPRKTRC